MRSLLLVLALLFGSVAPALAAEGGGLLNVSTGLTIWTLLIFGIVFLVLWKAAFPKILGAVEAREARLRDLMAQAERDRAAAAALVEQNRAELEQTRARVSEAMAESRTSGERMREEMLAETRQQQEEMLLRARQDIERERERALDSLRRDAVEIAMAAAERVVGRNLTTEDNRRLVQQFVGEMEGVSRPVVGAVPAGV
jgi:F-type H+-transporting ATPase subunit b